MMRYPSSVILAALVWCLPHPASAALLTFESLWEFPTTTVLFWTTPKDGRPFELISADYGLKPDAGDYFELPITTADPLDGFKVRTVKLPTRLGGHFFFGSLDAGGPCPDDCGWGTGLTDRESGDKISAKDPLIDVLWPTLDGGFAPILRVTYSPTRAIPEPALLGLLGLGAIAWRLRRRHQ